MSHPAPANDPKPRRSAWRWLTVLAGGLLVAAGVFLFSLERRENRRAEFERVAPPRTVSFHHWNPEFYRRLTGEPIPLEWFDRRLGEASVGLDTQMCPDCVRSPDQLHQLLESLRLLEPIRELAIRGCMMDDADLECIPPGMEFRFVYFGGTRITEAGLRRFCEQHRPATVIMDSDYITAAAIRQLEVEFPEIRFSFNHHPISAPAE